MAFLLGMLPVRNGATLLPRYLALAGRYMDGLVALDDGSTDETAAILAAAPLVRRLLANPRRDSYEGWDDGANRARLLEAAAALRAWRKRAAGEDLLVDRERHDRLAAPRRGMSWARPAVWSWPGWRRSRPR